MDTQTRPYWSKSPSVYSDDLRRRRRYDRSPSPKRGSRKSRPRSTNRDRGSTRKSSRERDYESKSMQSSNKAASSQLSTSYSPEVPYKAAQRTHLSSNTSQQSYPTTAAQDCDYYNYNYRKTSDDTEYQQTDGYRNKVSDTDAVDEDLMREIKEIFSDVDDDDDVDKRLQPSAAPETTLMSAASYGRTSPTAFEGQVKSLSLSGDKTMRSNSPSAVPTSLYLKIQSQLTRISNIKLLQERIQSRSELIYMALINHWKLDVEEIYNSFKKEHAFLEENWPTSLMDHEYFSDKAYNQMYTAYSSIMVTLVDMEQEVLKGIEQAPPSDSSPRFLLTSNLELLDDIPPQNRNDPSSLNNIVSSFANCRKAIQLLVPKEYLGDCLLIHRMTQLLDRPTQEAWNDSLGNSTQIPTFEEFDNFLEERIRVLERMDSVSSTRKTSPSTPSRKNSVSSTGKASPSKPPRRVARVSVLDRIGSVPSTRRVSPSTSYRRVARTYSRSPISRTQANRSGLRETIKSRIDTSKVTHSSRISKYPCSYCTEQHFIVACPSFRLLSRRERRDFVTKKPLCYNCLGQHPAKICTSNVNCKKCGRYHHTMIHILTDSDSE